MKNLAILGITGSIGKSTIQVVRQHPDKFRIVLASAHKNHQLLFDYAREFEIRHLAITSDNDPSLQPPSGSILYRGEREMLSLLHTLSLNIVLNAITGSAGLLSSLATISAGIDLALANKESLVLAGHLIKSALAGSSSRILPVDSEHSAIFQCLEGHTASEIKKIILTASGGPFRDLPLDKFKSVTLDRALKHPTWSMGAKVTIDSATMMNKALEVIEAHWLFDVDYGRIDAVIHPQSIVHSFLEFADGSIHAQISNPTMTLPILYALTYPRHIYSNLVNTSILEMPQLTFQPISAERFPLYYLGRECGETGGLMPTIMNAANEAALKLLFAGKINFCDIYPIIDHTCQHNENIASPDLETIIATNHYIYNHCLSRS
jgi:1-deoxy-D-xylulose-5-phosphate reductoisomerase